MVEGAATCGGAPISIRGEDLQNFVGEAEGIRGWVCELEKNKMGGGDVRQASAKKGGGGNVSYLDICKQVVDGGLGFTCGLLC